MKKPLALIAACLALAGCVAQQPITANQVSRYSDADEAAARGEMERLCSEDSRASRALLDKAKALNEAMEKSIANPNRANDEETDRRLKDVSAGNPGEYQRLDTACKQATARYGRIVAVRADAAQRADEINRERALAAPMPINCTSTTSGGTVYTTCH